MERISKSLFDSKNLFYTMLTCLAISFLCKTPQTANGATAPTPQALTSPESGMRLALSGESFYIFPDGIKCPLNDCRWFVGYDFEHNITLENLGTNDATDLVLRPTFDNLVMTGATIESSGDVQDVNYANGILSIGKLASGAKLHIQLVMDCPIANLTTYSTELLRENGTTVLDSEAISFFVDPGHPDAPSEVVVSVNGPPSMGYGQPAVFAISATNNSDHPAKELSVYVKTGSPLFETLQSVSLDPSGLANMFAHDDAVWKFNLPEIAPHQTGTVYCVIVSERAGSAFELLADVSSVYFEADYTNNSVRRVIPVAAVPF